MTSERGVISYPIPAYSNPPIEPQFYQPSRFVISAISLGYTTLVTTSVPNNYVIGQEVRLLIPVTYGSYQLNERRGYVLSLPSSSQVELNIDSLVNVNEFVSGTDNINTPQIIAIGDVNSGNTNNQGRINNITFVPGSFINISPL